MWTHELYAMKLSRMLERVEAEHRAFLVDFEQWLKEDRCFSPATLVVRVLFARKFLEKVVGKRQVECVFEQLTAKDVESFFVNHLGKYSVNSRRCMASSFRHLLRFTALRGWNESLLLEAVPSVFSYRLSKLPVGMSSSDIDRVLDSLVPDSSTRCRDRAIILLLATYAPRTGQISELRLSELKWRKRQIHFCAQKRSRSIRHTLTPAVAEAISLYVSEFRPQVHHDHVFVRHRRPQSPLSPSAIRSLVTNRFREAGCEGDSFNPRRFRYALVTRLLDSGQPYKLIADTLGHKSQRATAVYTKMNYSYLVEAAAEWQELT